MKAPLKPFRLYVMEDEDGDVYAFDVKTLEKLTDTEHPTIEAVAESLGAGRWHSVTVRRPREEHKQEAEDKILEATDNGGFKRNGARFAGALAEVLVLTWDLVDVDGDPTTPDESGFASLDPMVAEQVEAYLSRKLYPTAAAHKGFFELWKAKHELSATEQPKA